MKLLFYYNPFDHKQNTGVNFSCNHSFRIECTEKQNKYFYSLYDDPDTNAIDIFHKGNIVSLTALVGENGSGKTTIFRGILNNKEIDRSNSKEEILYNTAFVFIVEDIDECIVYYKIEDGEFQNKLEDKNIEVKDISSNNIGDTKKKESYNDVFKKTSLIYFSQSCFEGWARGMTQRGRINQIMINPLAISDVADIYYKRNIFRYDETIRTMNVSYIWRVILSKYVSQKGIQHILDMIHYREISLSKTSSKKRKLFYLYYPDRIMIKFNTIINVILSEDIEFLNFDSQMNPWERSYGKKLSQETILKHKIYWNANIVNKLYQLFSKNNNNLLFLYINLLFELYADMGKEIKANFESLSDVRSHIEHEIGINNNIDKDYYSNALREIGELLKLFRTNYDKKLGGLEFNRLDDEIGYNKFLEYISQCFNNIRSFILRYMVSEQPKLSSGQRALLNMASWLNLLPEFSRITGNNIEKLNDNIILMIDEIDLHLHPEWQRIIIAELLDEIKLQFKRPKKVQIILSTHSPLCLSDIPRENTIYLYNDESGYHVKRRDEVPQTFGREIYDLFKDSFFLKNTMGQFATAEINSILSKLELVRKRIIRKDGFKNTVELNVLIEDIEKRMKKIGNVYIEKYIKNVLELIKGSVNQDGSIL